MLLLTCKVQVCILEECSTCSQSLASRPVPTTHLMPALRLAHDQPCCDVHMVTLCSRVAQERSGALNSKLLRLVGSAKAPREHDWLGVSPWMVVATGGQLLPASSCCCFLQLRSTIS